MVIKRLLVFPGDRVMVDVIGGKVDVIGAKADVIGPGSTLPVSRPTSMRLLLDAHVATA